MSLSVLQAEAAKMAANPSAEKGESSVSLGRSLAWRLLIAFVKLWFSRVSLAVLKLTSLLNYRPHDLIHQTAVDMLTGAVHLYGRMVNDKLYDWFITGPWMRYHLCSWLYFTVLTLWNNLTSQQIWYKLGSWVDIEYREVEVAMSTYNKTSITLNKGCCFSVASSTTVAQWLSARLTVVWFRYKSREWLRNLVWMKAEPPLVVGLLSNNWP